MRTFEVKEKTTALYTATLKDETGAAIALVNLGTLTLTLFDLDGHALTVLNSRNAQDVKNANGGSFHATSGLFSITLLAADTAMVDSSRETERHRLQLDFTYNGGAKSGRHECDLLVLGSPKVS